MKPGADDWDGEEQVAFEDLPPGIQAAIGESLPPGHTVWRVPCADSRNRPVVEWWWLDEEGDLIEGFWIG